MIRRHWLAVLRHPVWLWFVLGAIVLHWLQRSSWLVRTWPSIRSFFPRGTRLISLTQDMSVGVALLLAFAGLLLLGAIGWWYATVIIVDDATLTVRMPLSANVIPLQAIQDIQTTRPFLGLLFKYGTLVIYSGNETEVIEYVPDVENVAKELYPNPRR